MSNHTTPKYNPATLTAAQADGLACVVCAGEFEPMRPVGITSDGTQVFACSSHVENDRLDRTEQQVTDATKLNDRDALTNREAALIFRLGCVSAVVAALESGIDLRDVGVRDVEEIMSAQEINEMTFFVRGLVAKRRAGAA